MKQHAFFFGVAYALSIGSVLLLGGRKDGPALAMPPSSSSTTNEPATTTSANNTLDVASTVAVVSECKGELPTQSQSYFAMVTTQESFDVFSDTAETKDDLPRSLKRNHEPPAIQVHAAETAMALSDSFNVDEDIDAIENPLTSDPTPTDALDDELKALAPTEPSAEDASMLTELREQVATLSQAKAELLNAKALETEISQLQKQIANLQAARRLHGAQHELEKLIQEFPESPAAVRAKSMLKPLPTSKTPQERLVPSPDPRFSAPKGA